MPPTPDNKSARLYRQNWSCKQIAHQMGYTVAKVHEQLAKAGITPDPAREAGKREHAPAEHLIGVEGMSDKWTSLLRRQQPQADQEEECNADLAAAVARVKAASIALHRRETANA